ncbi:MAG: hypothetical protein QOE66_1529 [Chloroflexota bacterium]|jgi:NADPH:quinone reductase-like Zn-dependent oxidoreductase|nr:hypothetical protein [Chloroflexota bacterium]
MKAYAIHDPEKPASIVTVPKPDVGPREVLVAIRAASVNGIDVFQANGYLLGMMEHRFPSVIGRDLAGVVEAVGEEIVGLVVGDEVFGYVPMTPPVERGSFAEWVSAADLVLARRPAALGSDEAAALPLAGSAALDLLDAVGIGEGDTLLVVGATGGVGSIVVQLATASGATVIATARPDEVAFIRDLGASDTIDYTGGGVGDAIRARHPDGITALIDLVTQRDALTELGSIVASGGRVATLMGAADLDHFAGRGVTAANVNARPTAQKLEHLASLASSGELRVPIQAVYPLDRAGEALAAFQQGTRGKLVLHIAPDAG